MIRKGVLVGLTVCVVNVISFLMIVPFQELKRSRPDALSQIRWDPLHQIAPISPDQQARVKAETVELKGEEFVR